MKLGYVTFEGYRRFLNRETLNTNGKMIALVGPNEAGKTSALRALQHLSHEEPFSPDERYKYDGFEKIEITACFFLDSLDWEVIGNSTPKKILLVKTETGARNFTIEPSIERDKGHRQKFINSVTKCLNSKTFITSINESEELEIDDLKSEFETIDFKQENIEIDTLAVLEEIKNHIDNFSFEKPVKYISNLPDLILDFFEKEGEEHPELVAIELLKSRIPKVLEFNDDDRRLETTFNMSTFKQPSNPNIRNSPKRMPCNALINLALVAELDLDKLKENFDQKKTDRITKQFADANEKLAEVFQKAWSQADLRIHLEWDKPEIHIMVWERAAGTNEFIVVDQRSDGLRQYIALFAFILKQDIANPILLIDEAELHLHYDAQADLIQTLTRKNLASKVIYTTHSAGCLPEDLGAGVKLIIPQKTGETFSTSIIENKFWKADTLGFSPILYGMGASNLAFFPTRMAVITEGQSDPLLMPTIFRQVSGEEYNNFQIVPGLANTSSKRYPLFELQGKKVSYLVDNDVEGNKYVNELVAAKVPTDKIFKVCSTKDSIITVEDWIDDRVYADAVEKYRSRHYSGAETFAEGYFEGDGKAEKLKAYEKKIGEEFSKITLSYFILEEIDADINKPIYKKAHKRAINSLRSKILKSFEPKKTKSNI